MTGMAVLLLVRPIVRHRHRFAQSDERGVTSAFGVTRSQSECSLPRPACGERVGVRGKPRRSEKLRGKDQNRTERARLLRRSLTPAEFALWTRLRDRQL